MLEIKDINAVEIDIMDTRSARNLHAAVASTELKLLGTRIREARLSRNLTQAIVAEDAGLGRQTVIRIEDGEEGVAIGAYAAVLSVLGLLDGWGSIPDEEGDRLARKQLRSRAGGPR